MSLRTLLKASPGNPTGKYSKSSTQTPIREDERSSRADNLQSAGAPQVIERMDDIIGLLSATPV